MSERDFIDNLLAEVDKKKKLRAKKMPDEQAAIGQLFQAYLRLKELGFNDAMYCPKDGTSFEAIEVGCGGIAKDCHYSGKWPDGQWWVASDGDLWPSSPILYRLKDVESKAK